MGKIRKLIKLIAAKLGLKITPIIIPTVNNSGEVEYEEVSPKATYSPWNKDPGFNSIYPMVCSNTLVDKFRCYELWKLVEQVSKLESGHLIEIGVWRGGTGALIAKQAMNCGINDTVYLCDTFEGVVKAGENDTSYVGGEHADTDQSIVESLVDRVGCANVKTLKGIFPDDTGKEVDKLSFRFCHIDVDVYQSAKDVVDWIWDKLVPGGIIVYDDFGFKGCTGIAKYVEEQMPIEDRLVFHNLNGHAIVVKLKHDSDLAAPRISNSGVVRSGIAEVLV